MAASYFCSPAPFKIGSYRPVDASGELDISVHFAISTPFWFDDQTGDYATYENGEAGPRDPAKLNVPLAWPARGPGLEAQVAAIQQAGQCAPSAFGVVPAETNPPKNHATP